MKLNEPVERRANRSEKGFERAYILVSIGCFMFAFLILAVVAVSMVLGDDFINAVFWFFGV